MKTKLILMALLFFAILQGRAQNNDIENIQAAFISPKNNKAYFFVGTKKVYQYEPRTQKRDWIRNLGTNAFKGVSGSSNVDAAVPIPNTKKVYLFKGNKYYIYDLNQSKVVSQGIVGYNEFKGLSGPFDAVTQHNKSISWAFFKGNKVYIYNRELKKVVLTENIGESFYKGVPSNVDAAVYWTNGKIYFLKADHYYRYDFVKKKVDKKAVINRDGFLNLFPRIDAALNIGAAFQKDYYWERASNDYEGGLFGLLPSSPRVPFRSFSELNKGNRKTTKFGVKHFEGVLPHVDAALYHPTVKKPYFLKGSKFYRYNGKTRKVDQTGDIKTAWDGLSAPIDAAFYNKEYCYFFKKDRFWKYNTKTKRLDSGNWIKTVFRGVPNYLDAAILNGREIYFYKKRTEYVYDINKRKVVARNSIAKIAK